MSEQQSKIKAPRRGPGGPGGGPGGPIGTGEKAKNFKQTMGKLMKNLSVYKASIFVVFIFAILSTLFTIVSPKILGTATDKIVDGYMSETFYEKVHESLPSGVVLPAGTTGEDVFDKLPAEMIDKLNDRQIDLLKNLDLTKKPQIDFDGVAIILIWLIALYAISAGFSYIQGFIMTSVAQKVSYDLRKQISQKMDRLPLKYFDTKSHGDILSRVTNDVDTVNQTLGQSLTQIVTSITMIIGILIMMFSINWIMTLVSLIVLPISMILISVVVKRSQKYFKQQQQYLGDINGHVEEMYSGHVIVKAFNGEQHSIETFKEMNKKLSGSAWKSQFFSGMMMPVMMFIGNIGYVAVCVVGGYLAVKGSVTIGNIQSFIQYTRQFNQPIAQVANIANILQSTAAAAERVFEFLEESEEVLETKKSVQLEKVTGKVEFKNVKFGYNEDKIVINDFSCTVMPGQKVAIVGPTGAGKTTIVKLLMRFYELNEGCILIDGVDIKDFSRNDLRAMFGMVLQDTWLFNGSIKENIRYGRLSASDEEVYQAA
ncbi:MAG: transporter, partial [Oscillospiraceae bacterium]|nr:transporter [Oscillospiraceae bacterium]